MTTRAESERMAAISSQTVADLRKIGAHHVADRMERCARERRHRTPGGGRNWTCRGAACPWCSRRLLARWQSGLFDWVGDGDGVSYASIPLAAGGHIRDVVRSYRRALRDLRDREGRKRRVWRQMYAAGIVLPSAGGRAARQTG